jgi:hypothetical protein
MGVMLGAGDMEHSLSRGNLRHWPLWLILGGLSYLANALGPVLIPGLTPSAVKVVLNTTLSFCCVFTILGSLGLARRIFTKSLPAGDSLSDNAYGIYIFHYMFVLWAQFTLLTAPVPAGLKFLLAFAFALAASWTLTALARRTPLARVL